MLELSFVECEYSLWFIPISTSTLSDLNFLIKVEHTYPDFHISMNCYECKSNSKDLTLHEHIDYKWLDKSELESLDWAAADVPVVNKLIQSN